MTLIGSGGTAGAGGRGGSGQGDSEGGGAGGGQDGGGGFGLADQGGEVARVAGVAGDALVVHGDDVGGVDLGAEPGGLGLVHVADDAAGLAHVVAAVDGDHQHVGGERGEGGRQLGIDQAVAGVVEADAADLEHVAQEPDRAAAGGELVHHGLVAADPVPGRHRVHGHVPVVQLLPRHRAGQPGAVDPVRGCYLDHREGHDDPGRGADRAELAQERQVQVVDVVVGAE